MRGRRTVLCGAYVPWCAAAPCPYLCLSIRQSASALSVHHRCRLIRPHPPHKTDGGVWVNQGEGGSRHRENGERVQQGAPRNGAHLQAHLSAHADVQSSVSCAYVVLRAGSRCKPRSALPSPFTYEPRTRASSACEWGCTSATPRHMSKQPVTTTMTTPFLVACV